MEVLGDLDLSTQDLKMMEFEVLRHLEFRVGGEQ
jgi:hypothetical protein